MNNEKRIKHSEGYWLLRRPDHPYRSSQGYVPEARVIMEMAIGRFISPLIEIVHHKDENVKNNELSNLALLTKSEHKRLHAGWKLIDGEWWKICLGCGKFLKVEGNFYKRKSGYKEYFTKCSSCVRQREKMRQPRKRKVKTHL